MERKLNELSNAELETTLKAMGEEIYRRKNQETTNQTTTEQSKTKYGLMDKRTAAEEMAFAHKKTYDTTLYSIIGIAVISIATKAKFTIGLVLICAAAVYFGVQLRKLKAEIIRLEQNYDLRVITFGKR